MKNRKAKKGFTIIELVIVIAVIGILAGVLIPTFSNVISQANETAAMESANNAYTNYLVDHAIDGAKNICIEVKVSDSGNDSYYFHVVNGQFIAEASKTCASDASFGKNAFVHYVVNKGTTEFAKESENFTTHTHTTSTSTGD